MAYSRDLKDYQYGSDVPAELILDWLTYMAWDRVEERIDVEVLRFIPISDPEDSGFVAMPNRWPDDDYKCGIKEAVFRAYKKYKAEKKAERRAQYEELRKEFEIENAV
jgi:hypothetical protein